MTEVKHVCGAVAVGIATALLTPAALAIAAPEESGSSQTADSPATAASRGPRLGGPGRGVQSAKPLTTAVPERIPTAGSRAPRARLVAGAVPQGLPAPSLSTASVTSSKSPLTSVLQGALNWFQHTFNNATPIFPSQTSTVVLGPNQTSQPITLGGNDPDGDALSYTIAGSGGGAGTAGGVLQISGGVAAYTPPDTWAGATTYDDTFTVVTTDAGSGLHIHGLPGLLHMLSFGLLGAAGDTATATVTVHVTPTATPGDDPTPPDDNPTTPVVVGSFPVAFVNNTGGVFRDDQIFVTIIGQVTPGSWSWVDETGAFQRIDHTAVNAPDHLVHDGTSYANMSFTIADAEGLRIPPELQGARIYVSVGSPLYIGIAPDDSGWAGPDPNNPTDPNFNTVFDWYELTTAYGRIPFGGNTTQVDQFGLPIHVTLQQAASGFSQSRGLTATRAEIFESFAANVPAEFQSLVVTDGAGHPLRILAPRTRPTGALASWFDGPVDDFWTKYRNETFTYDGPGYTVTGHVDANSAFAYTVTAGNASATYTMRKPTSAEIFAADGPFVGVGAQGAFLAELNAAFNRGVGESPGFWGTVSAYYPAGQRWNAYAKFFHDLSIANAAYGFPYDDVNSQSSVQILGNTDPPDRLILSIGY